MRKSWITGIVLFAIGLLFSFLADSLIKTPAATMIATFASGLATALFVIFSAVLMGLGMGLFVHWLLGFAAKWKASLAGVMLAILSLFVGIGASIGLVVSNGWTALQAFFTFLTLSITLFFTSICYLFGTTVDIFGITKKKIKQTIKKFRK